MGINYAGEQVKVNFKSGIIWITLQLTYFGVRLTCKTNLLKKSPSIKLIFFAQSMLENY